MTATIAAPELTNHTLEPDPMRLLQLALSADDSPAALLAEPDGIATVLPYSPSRPTWVVDLNEVGDWLFGNMQTGASYRIHGDLAAEDFVCDIILPSLGEWATW